MLTNQKKVLLMAILATLGVFFVVMTPTRNRESLWPVVYWQSSEAQGKESHQWQHEWAQQCSTKLALLAEHNNQNKSTSVAFLKTHKTGSTTVQNILLRYGDTYGLTFALPGAGNHMLKRVKVPDWLDPAACNGSKADIFCLHTDYSAKDIEEVVGEGAKWVTIMRHPDYLFESLYRYYDFEKHLRRSFEDFLASPPVNPLNRVVGTGNIPLGVNQMVRDLGFTDVQQKLSQKEDLEEFLEFVDERYDLVMINEHMDESLILLRHLLNWDTMDILSLALNSRTATSKKNPLAGLTSNQLENLRNINAPDHALYEKFLAKFQSKIAQFGSERMEAELQALHCLREELVKACSMEVFPARDLPKQYKPYGEDTVGYFPAVGSTASAELLWICERVALVEMSYIEQLRLKQKKMLSEC